MKRYLFALLALLATCLQASSDELFRIIDEKAGLCDNNVNRIRQDRFGMMWIATWNGLCRYDGLQFYTFQHTFNDESSIINNNVEALELADNGLWAGTQKGLEYLSFTSGRFSRCAIITAKGAKIPFSLSVRCLVANAGRVFAIDQNERLSVNGGQSDPTRFRLLNLKIKVSAACNYRDGLLAGVNSDGIFLLSADGKRVLSSLKHAIPSNIHTNIYYSKNLNAVIVGNGIGRKSMAFAIDGNAIRELEMPVPANLKETVDYGQGTAFAVDGGGVVVKEGGQQRAYTPLNSNISGDAVYTVFVDKDKNLWAGVYRRGANMLSTRKPWWQVYGVGGGHLTYDIATAVIPDSTRLYVGLDGGGINILNRLTGRLIKTVTADKDGLPRNNVVAMTKDESNLYAVIYTGGLVIMPLDGKPIRTLHMPKANYEEADNIWAIRDDGLGHIWIGGPNITVLNKKTGQMSLVNGLKHVFCTAFSIHNGCIWISSNKYGLYKVDLRSRKILAHYTADSKSTVRLPANDIKYVYVDKGGTVWFTSLSSGFYSLDENSRKITNYGSENGLTSHMVTQMTADNDGNMWLGTFNGLFRFTPKTKFFLRFDDNSAIPTNYTYASSCFYDGMIYAGSTNGVLRFNPRETSPSIDHNRVSFISLRLINNQNQEFPLFGSAPKSITLKHNQNFFSLKFTVPDVYSSGRVQFSCRLDGLESKWRELAGRRGVVYTNVPPGHYKFHVRCTNSNGQWGEPSVLEITITPPWYLTVWAKLLWALLATGAIGAGMWIYQHEMKIKQKVRISQIEKDTQRKLDEAKMNFYTNITHDLRTPVFLIAAQLEELLDAHRSIMQVPASYLQAMYRSAQKLNRLINRVIDFRKLDSGVLSLNLGRCDVASFCQNLTEDYEELCSQKRISFTFICSQKHIPLVCDAEKLEVILSNLVSNAFKYTNEGGRAELIVNELDDRVVFAVKDNGIGIVKEMRETIFKSFFRTERAERQSGGDGLGLSFVKQLVELHKGQISVESEVNAGSTFTFFIPKSDLAAADDAAAMPEKKPFSPAASAAADSQAAELTARSPRSRSVEAAQALPYNPAATHTVLVIDDEKDTVSLIERSLYADYKVLKAYDGEEGLALVRKELPDIVICDIMMPRMNGLEFLSTIKNDKTLYQIKVIIFTAKTSEEDMLEAYDNGADAYLTKPLSLKVLRKRIDRLTAQTDNATLANSIAETKKAYNKEEQIFLLRCREVIDDNLSNSDFNIDFMADKLAMSHSALYKKVKAITGMSLITFINDYKIYKAVQLFRQGMTNVDSVSELCGFHDVKNFREMFKRKMNITPKQFVLSL